VDRDEGAIDWDAAFEAIVAPLRPPRYVRAVRAVTQATVALLMIAVAAWMLLRVIGESVNGLGRPML
jgi:hypothetical protein